MGVRGRELSGRRHVEKRRPCGEASGWVSGGGCFKEVLSLSVTEEEEEGILVEVVAWMMEGISPKDDLEKS